MHHAHIMSVDGLKWLIEGWHIFAKNPATWVVMSLLYISLGTAVLLIPVVGTLAITLVWPALTAGLVYGANEIGQSRTLKTSHLFETFRHRELRRPLFVLGLLLASLVVVLTGFSMLLWSMGIVDYTIPRFAAITSVFVISGSLFYAIPSVVLGKARPLSAIKDSISIGIANVPAILLFAVAYLALLFLALIPLGLGLLILVPVTAGAMHTYYKKVSTETRAKRTLLPTNASLVNQKLKVSNNGDKKHAAAA